MSAIDHIHRETKQHCEMVTQQYKASCHLAGNPGNKQLHNPPPARKMKDTLLTHENKVQEHFETDSRDRDSIKKFIKSIHTDTVRSTLSSYPNNKVLNETPPDLSLEEINLSKKARSELSRLCSGYSRNLYSYLSRLNPEIQDSCPRCGATPHNTTHLFNCTQRPAQIFRR